MNDPAFERGGGADGVPGRSRECRTEAAEAVPNREGPST